MEKLLFGVFILLSIQVSGQWLGTNPVYFNNGSVGIGTSTPQRRLDVIGRMKFRSDNTNSAGFWLTGNDGTETAFFGLTDNTSTGSVGVYHAGLWRLIVGSSGYIGMGTTTPAYPLHIVAPAGNAGLRIGAAGQTTEIALHVSSTNYGYLGLGGNTALRGNGATSNFEGGVAIGTGLAPINKLEVDINSANTNYATVSAADLGLFLKNQNATNNNFNAISFGDASGYGVAHVGAIYKNQSTHTGNLFFSTRSGSALLERMRIDENGNVGIGTTNPGSFKLAVEGKIGAREVNVTTTTPWPDFVFETDYALPSLESLKVFINKNKHLPEIPTAQEVETNGINLGEMNTLLLKKVEELTLYMITLKEENQELKKEVQKINARLNDK
jgi:general stress protein 26